MRRIITVLVVIFSLNIFSGFTFAATLTWDGDGVAPLGGTGTWDTTSLNWWTGSEYRAWNNSNADDAVFDTAGGGIFCLLPMNVHNMSFNITGYTIYGGVNLAGTSPSIFVAADSIATITDGINANSGLTKTGPGLLNLQAYNNAVSGTIKASEGVLRLVRDGRRAM